MEKLIAKRTRSPPPVTTAAEIPRNSKWGWWNPCRGAARPRRTGCVCVCVCRRSADEYFFGGMGMEGERKEDRGLVAFCLRILNIRC